MKRFINLLLSIMICLLLLPKANVSADTSFVRNVLDAHGIQIDDSQYYLVCISAESVVSDDLKAKNFYKPEMETFVHNISIPVFAYIDNNLITGNYWLVSSDGSTVSTKTFGYDSQAYTEGNDNIIAFLIPKGAKYIIVPYDGREPYSFYDDGGVTPQEYCMFNGSSLQQEAATGYWGTADSKDLEFKFIFDWNAGQNIIKIEPFVVNVPERFIDMTSFAKDGILDLSYYIELRDPATGEIFPLPRRMYHNIGCNSRIGETPLANMIMKEDGVLEMQSREWDKEIGPHGYNEYYGATGEIDLYIPNEYEFRITLLDSTIYQNGEALYSDALYYSWHGEPTGDGFYRITDPFYSRFQGWDQILFAPLTEEIKVEKKVVGNDKDASYTFLAERTIYEINEDYFTRDLNKQNYKVPLRNYLYRLFDSATNAEIDADIEHRTDKNGNFELKGGQYALFKTYTLPADIMSYDTDGGNMGFLDEYDFWTDTEKIKDVYSFEEVSTGNFTASLEQESDGVITPISGRKAEEVYGTEAVYLTNTMLPPEKYDVTYEFLSDTSGYNLPQGIIDLTPADQLDIDDGTTVIPTAPATNTYTDTVNDGIWNFKGWDAESKMIDGADLKFTGLWSFTPNTYKVDYIVKDDSSWGVPEDNKVPSDTNEYKYQDKVTVADNLTTALDYAVDPNTGNHIPGIWSFIPWNKSDFQITKNTTITGSWIFEPDTFKVKYIVHGDDTYGLPEDNKTPVDSNVYIYNDFVDVTDDLTSACKYAIVDRKIIKGTWKFISWDKSDFNIRLNTIINGSWQFTPDPDPKPNPTPVPPRLPLTGD